MARARLTRCFCPPLRFMPCGCACEWVGCSKLFTAITLNSWKTNDYVINNTLTIKLWQGQIFNNTQLHLLSNLSHVTSRQYLKVFFKSTPAQTTAVQHIIYCLPKQNVILHCGILYPSLLGDICHLTLTITETHG